MDVTYCKSLKRRTRTALRNYLAENRKGINEFFNVNIPIDIKNFSSETFDRTIINLNAALNNVEDAGFEYDELFDLMSEYMCACSNLEIAEFSQQYFAYLN